MKWTENKIDRLKEMYTNKISIEEIAKELEVTKHAIRNKAYMLKITHPVKFTEEEKQYIKDNYKSYNLKEIAQKLGREKTNICRVAKEIGLERSGKKKENATIFKDEKGLYHKNGWVRKTAEETAIKKSFIMKKWHSENEHPKGMLGKHHTEEYCLELSRRIKEDWTKMTPEILEDRRIKQVKTRIKNNTLNPNMNCSNPYSRTKSGKRADLNNVFFRSSWEANMARYYNFVGIEWLFEPKTFIFPDIKRGCVSYTPDFYLPQEDRWVEIKGWMDEKSKTKIKRFKKYYPAEYAKFELITQKEYNEFKKFNRLISNWE